LLKRTDLQAIAQAKFDDAVILSRQLRFSNAYYLAGYAVEIGLKACIARVIFAETLPDRGLINSAYSHQLKELVGVAGLTQQLRTAEDRDPRFAASWALVNEWTPDVRYKMVDDVTAQTMIQAVGEVDYGVLPWIKLYW
jgi:hypothetical protein